MAPEARDPASRMNFNFFPQFRGGLPEPQMGFPPPSISPYLYPYQNFLGGSVVGNLGPMQNTLFEDYNGQGAGFIDNLIVQNPNEELPAQMEQFNFKQEEISEKDPEKEVESENMSSDRPKGCFCGETGDETLIKCRNCQKQFHFKCWQAQVMVDSICPACRLVTHCYTRLAGPPVLERWNRVDEQLVNSKKMNLSEEEMERLDNYVEMAEKSGRCWI